MDFGAMWWVVSVKAWERWQVKCSPVWAASQMGLESGGPVTGIDNPLANSSMGDLGGIPTNTSGINPYAQQWGDGTFNIEAPQPNTVLAAGVVLVGLIILFKVM
jgi:hypothetical protein